MQQTLAVESRAQLSRTERILLLLPLAASAFVGLFQLLFPTGLANLTNFSGNDLYIYQLSGAATFGYTVALGLALRQRNWSALKLVVLAFFTFGIGSLYACGADIITGSAKWVVYVVLGLTILFVCITGTILYRHRSVSKEQPDTAPWYTWFLVFATLLATAFGLFPLLLPEPFHTLFGLKGTDVFIFRQAGAATLGYAVMGVYEIRSRNWTEIRWPAVMAGVFNGLSFIASLLAIIMGQVNLLVILVTPASLLVTIGIIVALVRRGK